MHLIAQLGNSIIHVAAILPGIYAAWRGTTACAAVTVSLMMVAVWLTLLGKLTE